MRYQRFDSRLQVRLESGEKVLEVLTAFAAREGIAYGAVNGIGAVRWVRLAYLNAVQKKYEAYEFEEQLEVVSLTGNVTRRDGEPFFHLHISLARPDLSLIGGHFIDAIVRPTLEVSIQQEAAAVTRVPDEASGLALMDLPERG
ncbi:MAG: DNA-binding protein [Chloroflexota bacterium]|nr:DNA-binding protein [Chloroflexota bacterium]